MGCVPWHDSPSLASDEGVAVSALADADIDLKIGDAMTELTWAGKTKERHFDDAWSEAHNDWIG